MSNLTGNNYRQILWGGARKKNWVGVLTHSQTLINVNIQNSKLQNPFAYTLDLTN